MSIIDNLKNPWGKNKWETGQSENDWQDNEWDNNSWEGDIENSISEEDVSIEFEINENKVVAKFPMREMECECMVTFNLDEDGFTNRALVHVIKDTKTKKGKKGKLEVVYQAEYKGEFFASGDDEGNTGVFFKGKSVVPTSDANKSIEGLTVYKGGVYTTDPNPPFRLMNDQGQYISTALFVQEALIRGGYQSGKKIQLMATIIGNDMLEGAPMYSDLELKNEFNQDANNDGVVNVEDFTLVRAEYAAKYLFPKIKDNPYVRKISAHSSENIYNRVHYPKLDPGKNDAGLEIIFEVLNTKAKF